MTNYTYRKPKNAQEAINLVKLANIKVLWNICDSNNIETSEKYFEKYKPIVFIYKNDVLVGSAHNKNGVTIVDPSDRDVTKSYNKLVLREIDMILRQLELF